MYGQELLQQEFSTIMGPGMPELEMQATPVRMSMTIDVGTSKTRALPLKPGSTVVNAKQIIKIPNEYAILNDSDLKDLEKLEFEEQTFLNTNCIQLRNVTNINCPLYEKTLTISKGLLNDKLQKNSNFSVSNTTKYEQKEEYVTNAYAVIVSNIFSRVLGFLANKDYENAQKALNVELNLAYMLPDEEKLDDSASLLYNALQGTVEYSLPMVPGIKGKFTIKNNAPNQWLDVYGEAESVVYYFLAKNPDKRFIKAYKNHGVAVIDVGKGSVDNIFFKEKELMERASSTNRDVNGLTLINRTIKNIKEDAQQKKIFIKPTVKSIEKVLEDSTEELSLETPVEDYDISPALTKAKKEIASEIANTFKNTFEQNTVLGIDRLFLVILAGRTMTDCHKSPSLGNFIATRLSEQLNIPTDICKTTHPDSNILGAGLKLLMKMNKFGDK